MNEFFMVYTLYDVFIGVFGQNYIAKQVLIA
jgi:hypothetical protein